MKVVIIAGGRGERLRPITDKIPKPMVNVKGKPVLLHIINHFKSYGITDFILALCYLPEVITNYFGNGERFGVKIEYTWEDPAKPLGTAGAITLAKKIISDTFIVTYADILRELNIKKMVDLHQQSKAFATLNVYKRESQNAKSMVIIDNKNRVVRFIERPDATELKENYIWANGSFYIFEPQIFNFISKNTSSDFGKDIFPKILNAKKRLYAYPTTDYFIDIGNMEKLKLARRTFTPKIYS